MPKCMPIDTNQHNPTKIIDGCQVIIEILADKKTAVTQKMQLCNMAEIEKEEVEFPACASLWQGGLHKVAVPNFPFLCTWFSCIKKIGQSCMCWAVGP